MLSIAEFSKAVNLKECTIRAWVNGRKLTVIRLGRRIRIPETELTRLIAENTVPAKRQGR
jgi:excisionase family DNA binding protein